MLQFRLNPPSGYADSYTDIMFEIQFPYSDKAEVRLFNDTSESELEILSVSQGYIVDETVGVFTKASRAEGWFNVFNRDKLNRSLDRHVSVTIRCQVKLYKNGEEEVLESDLEFYNESKSLDGMIVPFDLHVENGPEIDLSSHTPLRISVVCDEEKWFELSIRNNLQTKKCSFEAMTKPGVTTFEIPAPVLYSDLKLNEGSSSSFDIYWTKFEGIDINRFRNRKYIKIQNTTVTFKPAQLMPQAQKRNDPLGNPLSDLFVLSDRYFVHCIKQYSTLDRTPLHPVRLKRLSLFQHESESMQMLDRQKVSKQEFDMQKAVRQRQIMDQYHTAVPKKNKQEEYLTNFSSVYAKKTIETFATSVGYSSSRATTENNEGQRFARTRKSGGCGCSRKR